MKLNYDKELYERRLTRANNARQQAEILLDEKRLELYFEVKERETAVVALLESEERYRLLVELSPFSILIEVDGRIVFANAVAQRLFCTSHLDDLLGWSFDSLMVYVPNKYLQNESVVSWEGQAYLGDGRLLDVNVSRVLFSYFGKPGVQIIVQDISEFCRINKEKSD
ncbi:PAS domain S-box protein [Glaciimonas immobilis]|uniref:PAS domain S-box-containing protein n=1 Tax=Glaciimonas immobilis TaxID=728004 RepID=A0A840RNN7_9BURK|nr:PAS domain S-box protein [Glaciimonas immobilis]KAF3999258.1 PAS domain S-box protein [Glaciimonas immobilis]MBB5198722.1 PAS domain S-box-containing protein [Glaciimonas immobilis]